MFRRPGPRPASPLFAFGAVLTVAGAVLYAIPGPGTPVLALGALILAVATGLWLAARQG
ncbi:hypothetical protein [Streptomyces sp. TBY4]|uniref:hypothetical protein n=1 Tax=Streptomyces sp. TBY4 TaxID=2962030 RepID=UPI0020B7DC26|nr:hypothetical protein [Streptomyces sp. TBY4]MCP3757220.1 hypothetical protein [Streptomyces sp. TBY4]